MQITVEGYKTIATAQTLDFDGLTILSGANSSGKSSFMQPFLILKQTIENHYDSGVLELYGENVKLTDSSQVISKVPGFTKKKFSLTHKGDTGCSKVVYRHKRGTGLEVDSVSSTDKSMPEGIFLELGMKSEVIEKALPDDKFRFIKELALERNLKPQWKVVKNKCFLNAEYAFNKSDSIPIKAGIKPAAGIENFVTSLIHVSGLRGQPERAYKIASTEQVFPGAFEKYVASIISNWSKFTKHESKYKELKIQLEQLGLASNIITKKVDETNVEIQISRFKNSSSKDDCVNISDVGFGVSQTLPVLVALLVAKKNQYVYVEQPELHLHPKAQFKLASIITSALKRGVKVIIETHSSILIRGIQIAVVKGELEAEKVSLNWFTQDEITGETNVSKAVLDEFGAFGDWPEDFDDITLKVEQMYLDAIEEKIFE